jgi:hypothetical protein
MEGRGGYAFLEIAMTQGPLFLVLINSIRAKEKKAKPVGKSTTLLS